MNTYNISEPVNTKTPPFLFDEKRAERLVLKLYDEYTGRKGLYRYENSSTAPQNIHKPGMKTSFQSDVFDHRYVEPKFVKVSKKKHVLWLFFATLTDRRQVSNEVYKAHVRLIAEYPELYTKEVIKKDKTEFGEFLAKYKIGVPRQSAEYWIRCADTLFNNFDGDPIKLINHCGGTVEGVQEYKKRVEKETGFDPLPGYGPKITSLLLLFLAELNAYEMPADAFPVDVHVQAIFLQYGAMTTVRDIVNDEAENFLRLFLCRMSVKYSLCKVALSHAFWIKGARLCTGCSKRKYVALLCSIEGECSGRINTAKYFSEGIWAHPLTFMRKGNSGQLSIQNCSLFDGFYA
ncbi:hypothetical protein K9M47_02020 [Candidatus Gracilibacteria bacterium]|nr:hypothetical protein [Candidatus Gracilibacteria bacterium]